MAQGTVNPGGGGGKMWPEGDNSGRGMARIGIMMILGAITAFGLFWIMQALISVTGELGEQGKRLSIEFVRLRKDNTPELKEREKPKREKPEQQPPPPQMNMAQNINPSDAVGDIVPMIDTGVELAEATSLGAGGSDREPVPLVRVDPDYPARAKQQGIRGYVEVEFTISPVGTVVNEKILRSKPPRVFDRASLQAVRRWKYNPMIKGGVAVARHGVQVRFDFDPGSGSR